MPITLHVFTCTRCRQPKEHRSELSTGYALYGKRNRKVCYECCADIDRRWMDRHGRIALYLSKEEDGRWKVTNWPGTLRFTPWYVKEGGHNMAGVRLDAWFKDHRARVWHGVTIGRWTQILHARRLAA